MHPIAACWIKVIAEDRVVSNDIHGRSLAEKVLPSLNGDSYSYHYNIPFLLIRQGPLKEKGDMYAYTIAVLNTTAKQGLHPPSPRNIECRNGRRGR